MNTASSQRETLKKIYGYDHFRPGQEEVIDSILRGGDVVALFPTGAGKSLCFQLPALLLPGLTLVISPLISLMKDQVDGLLQMGVSAAALNSSLSAGEYRALYQRLHAGEIKLLYVAPERLDGEGFLAMLQDMDISHVAVDEAHCISQWGHDFRPSYRRIGAMVDSLPSRPVLSAYTATATRRVYDDIIGFLSLKQPRQVQLGYDRPNLHYAVQTPGDRMDSLEKYIQKNPAHSGIVYCLTRKQTEAAAKALCDRGIDAMPYHAGLPDELRKNTQEDFINDRCRVIVATNAFGMGIDKSNVRFVIHLGMPKTMENYYQEAGRAGRDGEPADCLLLYAPQDIVTNKLLIQHSGDESTQAAEHEKLKEMIDYCHNEGCLRSYILRYFGQTEVPERCDSCQNCNQETALTDITIEAQKILSCVRRMGERYGIGLLLATLRGSANQRIRELGFTALPTYGLMRDYDERSLRELVQWLLVQGYLAQSDGEYPVISVSARGMDWLRSRQPLHRLRAVTKKQPRRSRAAAETESEAEPELFEGLRALRMEIAREQRIPAYQVFSDATLRHMCRLLPRSTDELLQVSGVGQRKAELYGEVFLAEIDALVRNHGIVRDT